ncbi:keratin, type I cytoskeletal 14-like [Symphalangus syndactylus]|uniref:keratin, type I cytoskeletal 14-like n=1 Tax=Symphalangus syndactylus TaxID=9590 RepID=UPI003004EBAA
MQIENLKKELAYLKKNHEEGPFLGARRWLQHRSCSSVAFLGCLPLLQDCCRLTLLRFRWMMPTWLPMTSAPSEAGSLELRQGLDKLALAGANLEMQTENLKEDLVYLKKTEQ